MPPINPPPRRKGRPLFLVAAIVLIVALMIFVGINLSQVQTKERKERGDVAPIR